MEMKREDYIKELRPGHIIAYKNEKIELDNPYEVYPYKYFINAYKRLNAIKKKR